MSFLLYRCILTSPLVQHGLVSLPHMTVPNMQLETVTDPARKGHTESMVTLLAIMSSVMINLAFIQETPMAMVTDLCTLRAHTIPHHGVMTTVMAQRNIFR